MAMMCPLGGVCDNSEMDEYSTVKSTGSGDDGSVLTVKLELCRIIKCPKVGEGKNPVKELEDGGSEREEYANPKIDL
jgi:hypothetical protein